MTIEIRPAQPGLRMFAIAAAAFLGTASLAGTAQADNFDHSLDGAKPSVWVDPDGCEHYALYNGWQGFMTPAQLPGGRMVCHGQQQPCLVASSDQLFATGSYAISSEGRRRLEDFFRTNGATSFSINGHTDNVGGYDYNIGLSNNRANAVAAIARQAGANVSSVQGFGYTRPRADNATAGGRALNRRVEVMCN